MRLSESRHLSANEHLLSTSDAEIGELGTAKSCREFKVKIKEVWGRRGWSCSCCLQCWHPVGALVHMLVAPLSTPLPRLTNGLGKAAGNSSSVRVTSTSVAWTCLSPGHLRPPGHEAADGKALSSSDFQINKYILKNRYLHIR